jgi:hypothetical protein
MAISSKQKWSDRSVGVGSPAKETRSSAKDIGGEVKQRHAWARLPCALRFALMGNGRSPEG